MQSVVDNPGANQGHVGQSESLIDSLAHSVHQLTSEIADTVRRCLSTLTELTYPVSDQLYNDGDILLHLLLQKEFAFQVDLNLTSSATRVMFNDSDQIRQQICLKMWLKCCNELYNTGDLTKRTNFLLEGLAFNRRFSGNVYYGIVPILSDKPDKIKCGSLIANPTFANLIPNRPYALVMKRLQEEWRLDQQLWMGKLGNIQGMTFLAHQVAAMHQRLNRSLPQFGTPERIADKLEFNINQFHKALDGRKVNSQIAAKCIFTRTDMKWIESASALLRQLSKAHQQDFKKRRREGHIKRCHGDLKASNLWICPPDGGSQRQEHLVALDCVDFNPEFCNIDTLSDVAMLAIDLETRLEDAEEYYGQKLSGQQLARYFLQAYLKAVGENETVWPLLEYYMTEKAMVCAYMSMLYDKLPSLGEKYLKVVLAHSQELAKYLPPHMGKRITRSLQLIAS